MKQQKFELGLKLLAFFTLMLFYYPAVMVSRTLLFHTDHGFLGFALICGMGLCGMLSANLILKEDKYKFIRVPLANLSVIIPVLVAIMIYISEGWLRVLFEIPGALFFYTIGLRKYSVNYGEMLDKSKTTAGIVLMTLSLIFSSYIIQLQYLRPSVFVFAYVALAFTFLILNQNNLERYVKKEKSKSDLFKNIRQRNAIYVIFMFAAVVVLFNLKNLVQFALGIILKILGIILKIIVMIIVFFNPSEDKGEATQQATQKPFTIPQDDTYSIMTFVWNVLITVAILYGVYKLMPIIARLINRAFRYIVNLIQKKFDIIKWHEKENRDYYDEIIHLGNSQNLESKFVKRKIRSLKRDLKKITDPVEKVRYIYNLILYMLLNKAVKVSKADTTGEIYLKSVRIPLLDDSFKSITVLYDKIRYGDRIPEKMDINKVENDYSNVADILKK